MLQLEAGEVTARSMSLISADKAEFWIENRGEPQSIIVDQNGDGIPDLKLEGKKKYRRANIVWEELPKTQ